MTDTIVEQAKAQLRLDAHERRAALTLDARAAAAQAVCSHFLEHVELHADTVIAAYWRIRDELDCQPILVQLMDHGHKVVLPVVQGADKALDLRVWEDGAALYPAGFGTLAPAEHAPRAVPDIILMPLLAFDAKGTRLGYGGGYYDRTLAALKARPRLIGLAFATQELDEIPREGHDVPLDGVISEKGLRWFGDSA